MILHRALAAVDPAALFRANVRVEGTKLHICDLSLDLSALGKIVVIGTGKGTAPMAQAAEEILGDRITAGAITVKYGHGLPLKTIRVIEAGHPVIDQAGLDGTAEILDLLRDLREDDLVLALITGGGSALLELPAEGITLKDLQATTKALLACGAEIAEINALRKHLSRVKGGQLLRAASPARVVSLVVSDVIGDPPEAISSGPTAPDPTTFAQVRGIIEKYHLRDQLPASVIAHLDRGVRGEIPDTPQPGDPLFDRSALRIIGSNRILLEAAREAAQELGYGTLILTDRLRGEARDRGRQLAALLKQVRAASDHPVCLLAGGEPTVTFTSAGKGGRNQELALAAALELDGAAGCLLLSAGSDGTDGPTDAAGAWADGSTAARARDHGFDPRGHLDRHDAYPLFAAVDGLIVTGPTRTNVMDLVVMLGGK